MTEPEFEAIIKNAAQENDRLKDRIEALENELERRGDGGPSEPGSIDDNPLCRGCYRWRLAFAVLMGAVFGLLLAAVFSEHEELRRRLAVIITGRPDGAGGVELIGCIITAAAPVLAATVEWRWLLYKHGYAGMFRAIAEMWTSFKKGLGK